MTAVSIVLTLLCSGCTDLPMTPDPGPPAKLGSLLGCRVDVKANTSRCEIVSSGSVSGGGASLELVHNAQWMVETGSGSFSQEDSTYRIAVRVVNPTSHPMGTPDETSTTGIKAFLPYRPMGYHGRAAGDTLNDPYGILIPPMTSLNQSVRARNPDGVQSFTATDQPYWEYPERIGPGETSSWREWEFTLHPDVSYFYFSVSVLAAVPGEVQAGLKAPDGYLIPPDSVANLFSPANLVMRHPRMSGLYPRNIVQIAFKRNASRDERQAAIDLIGGRLIGGMGGYFYQVLIQDDGTAAPLWNAVDHVSKLPQVESVSPDVMTLNLGP